MTECLWCGVSSDIWVWVNILNIHQYSSPPQMKWKREQKASRGRYLHLFILTGTHLFHPLSHSSVALYIYIWGWGLLWRTQLIHYPLTNSNCMFLLGLYLYPFYCFIYWTMDLNDFFFNDTKYSFCIINRNLFLIPFVLRFGCPLPWWEKHVCSTELSLCIYLGVYILFLRSKIVFVIQKFKCISSWNKKQIRFHLVFQYFFNQVFNQQSAVSWRNGIPESVL